MGCFKIIALLVLVLAAAAFTLVTSGRSEAVPVPAVSGGWNDNTVWHDGLVEKATYRASRVIYGQPREYTAIFLTNKEQHDRRTWTKAAASDNTLEVWKHNQIEAVPTPNYTYHFVTTSHLTTSGMLLTRLDQSSQEFCGTSFRHLQPDSTDLGNRYSVLGFSYMPEAGRVSAQLRSGKDRPLIAEDSLPLFLRDFPFGQRQTLKLMLLPTQKSNRATSLTPIEAEIRDEGLDGSDRKLTLHAGELRGTYWFAPDRQNVMTRYRSADASQTYDLLTHERTDYWTLRR
jgi:hypothetical protein